jgi:hypothetical protein
VSAVDGRFLEYAMDIPLVDGWMHGCLLEYEMDIPLVGGWMDDYWNMKWIFL